MMEEVELQQRLLAAGGRAVYVPEARAWHHVAADECTPSWTLHRHYRLWMSHALAEPAPAEAATWRSVPRWMWRRLWALRLRAWAANLIPDPEKRFKVQVVYHQWRGRMEGIRRRSLMDRGQ
jgi:GT2 family glycosyltransferase